MEWKKLMSCFLKQCESSSAVFVTNDSGKRNLSRSKSRERSQLEVRRTGR